MGSANGEVDFLYAEWKRLHCGPRDMLLLRRKPLLRAALSVPWLWWSHYTTARSYTTRYRSAMMATLFAWAFLTTLRRWSDERRRCQTTDRGG